VLTAAAGCAQLSTCAKWHDFCVEKIRSNVRFPGLCGIVYKRTFLPCVPALSAIALWFGAQLSSMPAPQAEHRVRGSAAIVGLTLLRRLWQPAPAGSAGQRRSGKVNLFGFSPFLRFTVCSRRHG